MLSDIEILSCLLSKELKIDPLPRWGVTLKHCSVDIHLGEWFTLLHKVDRTLDTKEPYPADQVTEVYGVPGIDIKPGDFILGHTNEVITLPANIAATLSGRSSLARFGLQVHVTAGHVDPGFEGQLTLEIANVSKNTCRLHVGQAIGQLTFHRLTTAANFDYTKGRYNLQRRAKISNGTG